MIQCISYFCCIQTFGGDGFFKHCFMILTHGDCIPKEGTLANKLDNESGTKLRKLIEKMGKKVIILDNRTSVAAYLRNELQKRVVHLVATNVKEPFKDAAIGKVNSKSSTY